MTFRRIVADFYQGIHEQMHCKTDLVAREVVEEVVDRLPSFIAPKFVSSAVDAAWVSVRTDSLAEREGFEPWVPRGLLWAELGTSLAHHSAPQKDIGAWREFVRP